MTQLRVRSEASGEGGRHPVSDRPSPALIRIAGLGKRFSSRSGEVVTALSDVNLDIRDNEFISVVGPSGCGKTTLLRILAGLESASSGAVHCGGASSG